MSIKTYFKRFQERHSTGSVHHGKQANCRRPEYSICRILVVTMVMSATLVGCGKAKQPWDKTYPTEGVINFEGQPLGGAQITLVPEDKEIPNTVRPRGFTKDDGRFELSTYGDGDGAPEGKYRVIAMRFPVVGSQDNPSQGPNDLPPKYSKFETTDLRVEITAPETDLKALDLKR